MLSKKAPERITKCIQSCSGDTSSVSRHDEKPLNSSRSAGVTKYKIINKFSLYLWRMGCGCVCRLPGSVTLDKKDASVCVTASWGLFEYPEWAADWRGAHRGLQRAVLPASGRHSGQHSHPVAVTSTSLLTHLQSVVIFHVSMGCVPAGRLPKALHRRQRTFFAI